MTFTYTGAGIANNATNTMTIILVPNSLVYLTYASQGYQIDNDLYRKTCCKKLILVRCKARALSRALESIPSPLFNE